MFFSKSNMRRRFIASSLICASSCLAFPLLKVAPKIPDSKFICIATSTFSNTVMPLYNLMFWKVLATPSLVILSGVRTFTSLYFPSFLPLYRFFILPCGWFSTITSPFNATAPFVGAYTPVITLKAVVLPAPLGPMRPMISPLFTSRLRSSTATTPPNCMVMSETRNTFSLLILLCLLPFICVINVIVF